MAKRKSDGSLCEEKVPKITSGKACQSEYLVDWKIENFRMIKSDKDLMAQQELNFVLGDSSGYLTKWCCDFEEKSTSDRYSFGIYLNLMEAPPKFKAIVNFSFQTIKPNGAIHKTREVEAKDMTALPSGWGGVMIPRNEEELEEIIWEDGSIVIRVKVKLFLFKPAGQPEELDVQQELDLFEIGELQKLRRLMANMMELDRVPDLGKIVKVVSRDGVGFYANTATLSARSPVFDAMFSSGNWREGQGSLGEGGNGNSLVLEDMSGKTVKVLLHFIMLGVLLKDEWKSEDVILELTNAAGEYQLEGLTAFLDKVLPAMNFGTRTLVKLTYLTKLLGMKNAEQGLFAKLKETMTDIEQLLLDKEGDLFEDN